MFQPSLSQSPASSVGRAACQESKRSGWNISATTTKIISEVTKKGENIVLKKSIYRVAEALMFQPSISISWSVTRTAHVQEKRADAILPGVWRVGEGHHAPETLHSGMQHYFSAFMII